jgi:hypothetical protein
MPFCIAKMALSFSLQPSTSPVDDEAHFFHHVATSQEPAVQTINKNKNKKQKYRSVL